MAGYDLSDAQKKKIEAKGIPVLASEKNWPTKELLEKYAKCYSTILLPSRMRESDMQLSKRMFAHVYQSVKQGKMDDGWKTLKI